MFTVINIRSGQWIQMNVESFDDATKVYNALVLNYMLKYCAYSHPFDIICTDVEKIKNILIENKGGII